MRMLAFLRRLHHPLMLILSVFPLTLLLLGPAATPMGARLLLYPAACMLLCALCLCVPGKRRLIAAAFSCALMLHGGFHLLPEGHPASLALLPLISAAALLLSLPLANRSIHEISPVFYVAGLASHVAALALFPSVSDSDVIFDVLDAPLTAFFLAYMLLLLLSLNRISLDNAAMSRHRLPASLRRTGTLLTLLFLSLGVLLSLIPAIARGLLSLWHALQRAAAALDAWLMRLLPVSDFSSAGSAAVPPQMTEAPAVNPPSLFALIVERISEVLAAIVLGVGLIILLQLILRGLRRLARTLYQRMHSFAAVVSEDYEDEITDTREDGEAEGGLLPRLGRRAAPAAQPQTPREHIRVRYARLLRRHGAWSTSSTARENLPQDAAALYERARYSAHDVTQEDAQRFLEGTKRL